MRNSCPHESVARKTQTWLQGVLRRYRRNGFSGKEWVKTLPSVGRDLETLGKSTEAEFLVIGEELEGFHRHAGEISRLSTSVAQLMAGEEIATVIEGFGEVVDRIKQLQGESRQNAETLRDVLQTLTRLNHQLNSFRVTVRTLRVLCVSTRIESARFGQRDIGFNGLADEVEKLAVVIEEKTSHLLARSESLSRLIGEVLVRVSELETTQHAQAEVILGKTVASLGALSKQQASSAAGVQEISHRYDAISRNIGEIVTSVQTHDITRQRIEHATEALDAVTSQKPDTHPRGQGEKAGDQATFNGAVGGEGGFRFRWPGRRSHAGRAGVDLHTAGDICGIQAAQLRHARDLLVAEVENILENLSQVAGHVTEMSREMEKMAGTDKATGQSFLSEIETGFATVMSALSAYGAANRELSAVTNSVGDTLQDMSAYSGDVEGIGAQIRLIALNAIVKASHMGQEGASLAVLAEAVHHLSVETCERTGAVGETLGMVLSASESLCAGMVRDKEGRAAEVGRLRETLRTLLDSLHGVNRDVDQQLAEIHKEGCNLADGIQKTIAGVSVHRRIDQVLSEVISRLEEIVGLSSAHRPPDVESQSAERVRALEAAYTMQGERNVHQAALSARRSTGGKTDPTPLIRSLPGGKVGTDKPDGKANDDSESDLGDNVELF